MIAEGRDLRKEKSGAPKLDLTKNVMKEAKDLVDSNYSKLASGQITPKEWSRCMQHLINALSQKTMTDENDILALSDYISTTYKNLDELKSKKQKAAAHAKQAIRDIASELERESM